MTKAISQAMEMLYRGPCQPREVGAIASSSGTNQQECEDAGGVLCLHQEVWGLAG